MVDFQSESKKVGIEFESRVLNDLYNIQGFKFINRNVYMKGTGCEVDFVAMDKDRVWHVEAKGGNEGDGKRPGAQRTDSVKKCIANASLIKQVYPDIYYVAYFSSTPKSGTYSEEMINLALNKKILNCVIYLEYKELLIKDEYDKIYEQELF
jgi:Holliday junction resolvase-like predicted endonuclease